MAMWERRRDKKLTSRAYADFEKGVGQCWGGHVAEVWHTCGAALSVCGPEGTTEVLRRSPIQTRQHLPLRRFRTAQKTVTGLEKKWCETCMFGCESRPL